MNKKFLGIGALVAVVVLLGGLWAAGHFYAGYKIKQIIAKAEKDSPGTKVTYQSYSFQPWNLKWVMKDVVVSNAQKQIDVNIRSTSFGMCDVSHTLSRYCTYELEGVSATSKDATVKEMISSFDKTLGVPHSLNIKGKQSYNPNKNFLNEVTLDVSQKGLFKSNLHFSIAGLDIETLAESAKSMLGENANNTAGLMFLGMSMANATQVNLISVSADMEKQLGEKIKTYFQSNYTKGVTNPELLAFLNDPRSFKMMIQPEKNKAIGTLVSDPRSKYGVKGWVELLGAKLTLNEKQVDLVAMFDSKGTVTADSEEDQGELKIKRSIAE